MVKIALILSLLIAGSGPASAQNFEEAAAREIMMNIGLNKHPALRYFQNLPEKPEIKVEFTEEEESPEFLWRASGERELAFIRLRISNARAAQLRKEINAYLKLNAGESAKRAALFLTAQAAAQLDTAKRLHESGEGVQPVLDSRSAGHEAFCFRDIYGSPSGGCLERGPLGLLPAEMKRWEKISGEGEIRPDPLSKKQKAGFEFHLQLAQAFESAQYPERLHEIPQALRKTALLAELEKNENLKRQNGSAARILFDKAEKEWLQSQNRFTRKEAVFALSRLDVDEKEKLRVLEAVIKNKFEDTKVHLEALMGLEKIDNPKVDEILVHALMHGYGFMQWNAARMLGNRGSEDPKVAKALAASLGNERMVEEFRKFSKVGEQAGIALGKIGASAAPECIRALSKPGRYEQSFAAQALGQMGEAAGPEAVKALSEKAADPGVDHTVMAYVIDALGQIGKTAVPELAKLAQSGRLSVRTLAVKALGNIRDIQSVRALIQALQDDDWSIRVMAVKSLGYFERDAQEAAPALKKMLTTPKADGMRDDIQRTLDRLHLK